MSGTDTASKLRDVLVAGLADGSTTSTGLVEGLLSNSLRYTWSRPLDVAASTASVDTLDASTALRMKVSSFKITAAVAVTETDTDLATLQLVYNNGNGGSDTVVALAYTNIAGGLGNLTANKPASFSVTAGNSVIPAGSCLQLKTTKGGNGVALPYRSYEVKGMLR